jgi:hypothetical protein
MQLAMASKAADDDQGPLAELPDRYQNLRLIYRSSEAYAAMVRQHPELARALAECSASALEALPAASELSLWRQRSA